MSQYQLEGTIKLINDTQTFPSGFSKREFVVTTGEKYPQDIKLEFAKDKCTLMDKASIGQSVTVDFNIRGNEYNGKYYVNLQAWRIEFGEKQAEPRNEPSKEDLRKEDDFDDDSDFIPF